MARSFAGMYARAFRQWLWTLLIMGCSEPAGEAAIEQTGLNEQNVHPLVLTKEALVGEWMPEDYCACLGHHRSAFTCASLLRDIYVMMVSPKGPDSLVWGYITTHEGGPEIVLGHDALTGAFSYQAREDEHPGYGMISIRSIDPDHLELTTEEDKAAQRFRRVEGETALLNSALFEGLYEMVGDTTLVRFGRDGTVVGLEGIDHYTVLTDFTEGLDDRDIVFLYSGEYDWRTDAYHYRREGNDILLFPMDTTADEYVYLMGELEYRLRQVKH